VRARRSAELHPLSHGSRYLLRIIYFRQNKIVTIDKILLIPMLGQLFLIFLGSTLIVYLLRGLGILTFLPGGIILILGIASLILGLWYGIQRSQKF
jgi:predicted tellurium resistance membrane protein TerC